MTDTKYNTAAADEFKMALEWARSRIVTADTNTPDWQMSDNCALDTIISALQSAGKVEGLVGALEFYANNCNWESSAYCKSQNFIQIEGGKKAQAALDAYRKGEGLK